MRINVYISVPNSFHLEKKNMFTSSLYVVLKVTCQPQAVEPRTCSTTSSVSFEVRLHWLTHCCVDGIAYNTTGNRGSTGASGIYLLMAMLPLHSGCGRLD